MKSWIWVLASLLVSFSSSAAERKFFLNHHSWIERCGLIFTGFEKRNDLYAQILEKTKIAAANPEWKIIRSVRGAELIDRYELDVDFGLAANEVPASEDYFFDIQNELIKIHGPNEPQWGDQLVIAVGALYRSTQSSVSPVKVARLIQFLSRQMGYRKALRWLTDTWLNPTSNLKDLWTFPLVVTTRMPVAQWENLSYVYEITPSALVAGAKTNQSGYLTGDRFELANTLNGLLNRMMDPRVTGATSSGAKAGSLSPERVTEELEEAVGGLAHLLLTGQTQPDNVRWAIQHNQTKLNQLRLTAFKEVSPKTAALDRVRQMIEAFGGSFPVFSQR